MDISTLNKAQLKESYFKKHIHGAWDEIRSRYPDCSWSEALYLYSGGKGRICPVCGKQTNFINQKRGYSIYCSTTCANKEVAQKVSKTKRDKGTSGWLEKYTKTCLERYGVRSVNSLQSKRDATSKALSNKFNKHDEVIRVDDGGNWICKCPHPNCNQCQEKQYIIKPQQWLDRNRLKIEPCTKLLPIQPHISTLELHIREMLDEMGIEYVANDRRFGVEMDIYIPSLQLAIEVNGSYWHSIQFKSPSYHVQKSLLLADNGVRCVFVWDDYLEDDIKGFLKAIIEGNDLEPWKQKWFPGLDGWPVDFGLVDGDWREYKCQHGGFECYDAGEIVITKGEA